MVNIEKPDFNFFVPIECGEELRKAAKKDRDGGRYDNMVVKGVASDSSRDTDDETLDPNGFELSRFLKYGWINYDHRAVDSPKFNVGEPIGAEVRDNQLHVKGRLFKGNKLARDIWDTMIMLENSDSTRKMGWSIEGKALERDKNNPKRVRKALITNIALTPNPKNANSYADIVKGEYFDSFVSEYRYNDNMEKSISANGGSVKYLVDVTDHKSGIRYTIDTDLRLKVEKAISTETAAPLVKEDLERKLKVLQYGELKKSLVDFLGFCNRGVVPKEIYDRVNSNMDIYKKYI